MTQSDCPSPSPHPMMRLCHPGCAVLLVLTMPAVATAAEDNGGEASLDDVMMQVVEDPDADERDYVKEIQPPGVEQSDNTAKANEGQNARPSARPPSDPGQQGRDQARQARDAAGAARDAVPPGQSAPATPSNPGGPPGDAGPANQPGDLPGDKPGDNRGDRPGDTPDNRSQSVP